MVRRSSNQIGPRESVVKPISCQTRVLQPHNFHDNAGNHVRMTRTQGRGLDSHIKGLIATLTERMDTMEITKATKNRCVQATGSPQLPELFFLGKSVSGGLNSVIATPPPPLQESFGPEECPRECPRKRGGVRGSVRRGVSGALRAPETPRRTLPRTPPRFRGHSRGHCGQTSGPKGPKDSCSRPGGSQLCELHFSFLRGWGLACAQQCHMPSKPNYTGVCLESQERELEVRLCPFPRCSLAM